jgi:hypothetical protein
MAAPSTFIASSTGHDYCCFAYPDFVQPRILGFVRPTPNLGARLLPQCPHSEAKRSEPERGGSGTLYSAQVIEGTWYIKLFT